MYRPATLILPALWLAACDGEPATPDTSALETGVGETADTKGIDSSFTDDSDDSQATDDSAEPEVVEVVITLTCDPEREESYEVFADLGLVPGTLPPRMAVWAAYNPAYLAAVEAEIERGQDYTLPPSGWLLSGQALHVLDGQLVLNCVFFDFGSLNDSDAQVYSEFRVVYEDHQ